jgi:hypothetical protein
MRYWGYFAAKLAVAAGLIAGVWSLLRRVMPKPEPFMSYQFSDGFGVDLGSTTVIMLFWLFTVGVIALVVIDQRYRCRTCLRRLRMPVETGSWPNMLLIGRPRIEYICPYGHGTLRLPEVQIDGRVDPEWQKHDDDIWKELSKK